MTEQPTVIHSSLFDKAFATGGAAAHVNWEQQLQSVVSCFMDRKLLCKLFHMSLLTAEFGPCLVCGVMLTGRPEAINTRARCIQEVSILKHALLFDSCLESNRQTISPEATGENCPFFVH